MRVEDVMKLLSAWHDSIASIVSHGVASAESYLPALPSTMLGELHAIADSAGSSRATIATCDVVERMSAHRAVASSPCKPAASMEIKKEHVEEQAFPNALTTSSLTTHSGAEGSVPLHKVVALLSSDLAEGSEIRNDPAEAAEEHALSCGSLSPGGELERISEDAMPTCADRPYSPTEVYEDSEHPHTSTEMLSDSDAESNHAVQELPAVVGDMLPASRFEPAIGDAVESLPLHSMVTPPYSHCEHVEGPEDAEEAKDLPQTSKSSQPSDQPRSEVSNGDCLSFSPIASTESQGKLCEPVDLPHDRARVLLGGRLSKLGTSESLRDPESIPALSLRIMNLVQEGSLKWSEVAAEFSACFFRGKTLEGHRKAVVATLDCLCSVVRRTCSTGFVRAWRKYFGDGMVKFVTYKARNSEVRWYENLLRSGSLSVVLTDGVARHLLHRWARKLRQESSPWTPRETSTESSESDSDTADAPAVPEQSIPPGVIGRGAAPLPLVAKAPLMFRARSPSPLAVVCGETSSPTPESMLGGSDDELVYHPGMGTISKSQLQMLRQR